MHVASVTFAWGSSVVLAQLTAASRGRGRPCEDLWNEGYRKLREVKFTQGLTALTRAAGLSSGPVLGVHQGGLVTVTPIALGGGGHLHPVLKDRVDFREPSKRQEALPEWRRQTQELVTLVPGSPRSPCQQPPSHVLGTWSDEEALAV